MKAVTAGAMCVSAFVFGGCASITGSEMQPVTLSTKSVGGQAVEKAKCTLKNDKGAWEVTSPGVVSVHRSAEDLMVECKSEGFGDGFLRAISRAAAGMWGNIIFGGGIGAIIDHNKGNGYDYPNDLPVKMGESVVVDKRTEAQVQQAAAQNPSQPSKQEPIAAQTSEPAK
jgi:hypothetical protein